MSQAVDSTPKHPPKSMTAWTFERLRSDILEVRHQPGERLRIDALCEALSTSPGAVREALSRLTAEGLVVATPQKGFMVAPISKADLLDLTDVRIHIECLCLERSILNGDLAWEGRVIASFHQLSRLTEAMDGQKFELEEWARLHEQFHDALTSACNSEWWLKMRRQLYGQSERYRRLSGPRTGKARNIDGEHKAITDATLARDVPLATARLAKHLRMTTDIVLRSSFLASENEQATT